MSILNPLPELTPILKQLRLSGLLESLEARNREAIENKLSYPEFLALMIRKRLGNYIFPSLCRVLMMIPPYNDTQGIHHESEVIEKRDQSPALA